MVEERRGNLLEQWVNLPALLAVTFWGSTFVVVRVIVQDDLSPFSLAALRVIFGALILIGAMMLMEKDWKVSARDLPMLALLGLSGLALFQMAFTMSLKFATASNVSVITAISPMIVAIIVAFTRLETLRWRIVAGLVIAFGGVTLVAQREGFDLSNAALLGDVLALISAIGWGIYGAGQMSLLQKYSATKVMAYAAAFGSVFILPFTAGDLAAQDWSAIPAFGWFLIVYYIVVSGYVATVLWSRGIHKWGPARTSAYSYLNPVFGILSGVIFLGETMVAVQIAGTVAVFVGLAMARR